MPEIALTQVMSFNSDAVSDGDLEITQLAGSEELNKPYVFDLAFVSAKPDIDLAAVLKKPAWIGIKQGVKLAGSDERASTTLKIHGVIESFEQTGKELDLYHYSAVLVPKLKRLALTHQSRVFQEIKIPDMVKSICQEHGVEIDLGKLSDDYKAREYIVQYEESDLDFIHRWMEHEGIVYYFIQEDDHETLVLADAPEGYGSMAGESKFKYRPMSKEKSRTEAADSESAAEDWFKEEVITGINVKYSQLPKEVILRDYSWEDPTLDLECKADVDSDGVGTVYRYNSHYKLKADGERLAGLRADELISRKMVFTGTSDSRGFRAGMKFTVEEHFRSDFNMEYVVTSVSHAASQSVSLGQSGGSHGASYFNTFVAVPKTKIYRPSQVTPWPRIKGVMHAKVDGADASTPYAQIDGHGRYKVRMPLDRGGSQDGSASKYVRKSEPYAGPNQGMHFPLLKNSEVMLTYVDGDPDRPVIAGAMYNGDNNSVVKQGNNTQNALYTPGGSGLVLDDTVDKCYINLHTKDKKIDLLFDATKDEEKIHLKSTDKQEIKLDSAKEFMKLWSKKEETFMRLGKGNSEAEKTSGSVTVAADDGVYVTTDGKWNQYTKKDANIIIGGKENKQIGEASDWTIKGEAAEYKYGDWFTFKAALTYGIAIGFTADFKLSGGIAIAVGVDISMKASATFTVCASASFAMNFAKKKEINFDGLTNVANKARTDTCKKDFTLETHENFMVKAKKKITLQGDAAFPPPDQTREALMKAWAAKVAASKGKGTSAPPPPHPGPPPLPAKPKSKIEIDASAILLQFDLKTKVTVDASGITLKCGSSELKVGPSGITAKPMVQGG